MGNGRRKKLQGQKSLDRHLLKWFIFCRLSRQKELAQKQIILALGLLAGLLAA